MGDLARGHGDIAGIVIRSEERDIVSRLGAGRVEGTVSRLPYYCDMRC